MQGMLGMLLQRMYTKLETHTRASDSKVCRVSWDRRPGMRWCF